jgi:hypothetical protein
MGHPVGFGVKVKVDWIEGHEVVHDKTRSVIDENGHGVALIGGGHIRPAIAIEVAYGE